MATSSSNKMPLLIDRPLHSFATVGGASALTTSSNFNTPTGGGCVLLVDCISNDGAVVDSISIVANQASTTASKVLVFLSVASTSASITSANTVCVASESISSVSYKRDLITSKLASVVEVEVVCLSRVLGLQEIVIFKLRVCHVMRVYCG